MIIVRTPFRISFAGGGSDLPAHFTKERGAVISTTIDKYMYITLNRRFTPGVRLSYSQTEFVDHAKDLVHDIARHALALFGRERQVEINSISDIPSGTGLGSSSSYAVGLAHALAVHTEGEISKEELAEVACNIEMDLCHKIMGKQDQYAAAFGGLNHFEFGMYEENDNVKVNPFDLPDDLKKAMLANMAVVYTKKQRSANDILIKQTTNMWTGETSRKATTQMTMLADDLYRELAKGNINRMGEILHENWTLKKTLSDISNPLLDQYYETAMASGATGGKVLGAGGGGFMLFYAPGKKSQVLQALNLPPLHFGFDTEGSKVIYHV